MVFILAHKWNEMKYVWMNEVDSVLSKSDSLVDVPYIEPSFLGSLDVKSTIPRSHGIWTSDMKKLCAICNMLRVMCKMLCVVCNMISMIMHVISWHDFPNPNLEHSPTFLIRFGKSTDLTFHNHVVRKELFLLMHVFGVFLACTHT